MIVKPFDYGNDPIKVVLVGDESVGKTALLNRWINNNFYGNLAPTIGSANQMNRVKINDEEVILNVWDTAGAERYRSLTPIYITNSMGVMIVFDITKKETFNDITKWIEFVRDKGDIPILIVGNKCDIEERAEVQTDECESFCNQNGFTYFITSARTGQNVENAFKSLASISLEYAKKHRKQDSYFDTSATEYMKRPCC